MTTWGNAIRRMSTSRAGSTTFASLWSGSTGTRRQNLAPSEYKWDGAYLHGEWVRAELFFNYNRQRLVYIALLTYLPPLAPVFRVAIFAVWLFLQFFTGTSFNLSTHIAKLKPWLYLLLTYNWCSLSRVSYTTGCLQIEDSNTVSAGNIIFLHTHPFVIYSKPYLISLCSGALPSIEDYHISDHVGHQRAIAPNERDKVLRNVCSHDAHVHVLPKPVPQCERYIYRDSVPSFSSYTYIFKA